MAAGLAALAAIVVAGGALLGYQVGGREPATDQGHGLRLVAPSRYAPGVPAPVSFTIPGTGRPGTVTVDLNLGRPSYSWPNRPVVLRRDQPTGRWTQVALNSRHGDWRGSYRVTVPGGPSVQRLLLVPAAPYNTPPWGAGRLRVRVLAAGRLLGAQSGPAARIVQLRGSWDNLNVPVISRGSTSDLAFSLRNPFGYRLGLRIWLHAFLCDDAGCVRQPAGTAVQWLDSGTWRALPASVWSGGYQPLGLASAPGGGLLTVRFRLIVARHGPAVTGELQIRLSPDTSGLPRAARLYPGMIAGDSFLISTM
jgi:hypothetical protein